MSEGSNWVAFTDENTGISAVYTRTSRGSVKVQGSGGETYVLDPDEVQRLVACIDPKGGDRGTHAASKTIERAAIAMALGLLVWVAVWLRLSGVPTTTMLEYVSRVMLAVPITVGVGFVFGVLVALRAKQ